jgi:hypothetical protein
MNQDMWRGSMPPHRIIGAGSSGFGLWTCNPALAFQSVTKMEAFEGNLQFLRHHLILRWN